ncbi:MAG: uracil-DNA glycosylase [Rhodoblastus sp.]|nr:MAG: uracil-DNA glycosylase [Rhodoblastus sp.]
MAASDEPERALESLFAWHAEAGLDWAASETPVDRFAPETTAARGETQVAGAPPRPPTEHPARQARTLDELRAALLEFDGCALKTTATQLVFADGTPGAPVMVIGEAPGADEDRVGLPFVGRAGRLLDKMLASIGLDRDTVYIANVVPWRPPGNRTPSPQETAACLPFLLRQIELAAPQIILCVGGPSSQTVLGLKEGIMRSRGAWRVFESHGLRAQAMATLHPAYLLRSPQHKALAWRDLRAVRAELDRRGLAGAAR